MNDSGEFFVSVPQLQTLFTIDTKQPARYLKTLLGKDLTDDIKKGAIVGTRDNLTTVELMRIEQIEQETMIRVDEFEMHPYEAVRQVSQLFLFAPSR